MRPHDGRRGQVQDGLVTAVDDAHPLRATPLAPGEPVQEDHADDIQALDDIPALDDAQVIDDVQVVDDIQVIDDPIVGGPDLRSPTRGRPGGVDFRRIWAAHSVSVFGDQLSLVALPLATFAVTDSAVAVGIVASAEAVTAVAFGLPAGALADRLPHRRVLVRTDLVRAIVLALLVVALVTPIPDLPALVVAALAVGGLRVAHDAAASAVLPIIVARRDLIAANGRMQGSESASTATGPALAGVLIAVGGPAVAFAADALSFVASGLTIRRVPGLDRPPEPVGGGATPGVRRAVGEGLRALADDPQLVRLVLVGAALNVMSVCLEAQFIPYADRVLDVGAFAIGVFFAIGGTSAVITSTIVARRVAARGDVILAAVAVYAAGVLLAGLLPSLATAAVAFVAAGSGSAIVATHLAALRQRRFPVHLQGRVAMAIRTLVVGVMVVPLIGGGYLSAVAGPEVLFVVAAAVGTAAVAWALVAGAGKVREV